MCVGLCITFLKQTPVTAFAAVLLFPYILSLQVLPSHTFCPLCPGLHLLPEKERICFQLLKKQIYTSTAGNQEAGFIHPPSNV